MYQEAHLIQGEQEVHFIILVIIPIQQLEDTISEHLMSSFKYLTGWWY